VASGQANLACPVDERRRAHYNARFMSEWIGARYKYPGLLREAGKTIQPDVVLWMEMPSGMLMATTLLDPQKPASFADIFEEAMRTVNAGSLPRPASIRVPSDGLAKALRRVAGGIPITVAPVPELDAVFAKLIEATAGDAQASYLDGGNIPVEVVAEFFEASQSLFNAAPWSLVLEHQLVGVDIPKLKIKSACVSVIGNAGESSGLLLFRSVNDYVAFGNRRPIGGRGKGFSVRSMSFGSRKELPPSMMREIKKHRWPVAGPLAYPTLFGLDRAMEPLPITAHDYRIMTKLAQAFLVFFKNYGSIFETDQPEAIQRSFTDEEDVKVTFTAPF
jgi:hypothetical protein